VVVRFIEFMPLGEDRNWTPDVVVGYNEILDILHRFRPLVPLPATTPGETAMPRSPGHFAERAAACA
jgi:cyclic pyranopterin phosphate synthase